MSLKRKLNQTILLQRSRTSKKKNQNLKTSKTWKISMPKRLSKNFSWTKSLLQTTTTRDGSGCNSLGFAWQWSATIPTNWENVSPRQLHICQWQKRENSPFVIIILFRSVKDCIIGKKEEAGYLGESWRCSQAKEDQSFFELFEWICIW